MSTVARRKAEPRIQSVEVTDQVIIAHFVDGRTVSVPLWWSWRLEKATPTQRRNFQILGDGDGVRWPDVDEDLSARGFLEGSPAPRPQAAR